MDRRQTLEFEYPIDSLTPDFLGRSAVEGKVITFWFRSLLTILFGVVALVASPSPSRAAGDDSDDGPIKERLAWLESLGESGNQPIAGELPRLLFYLAVDDESLVDKAETAFKTYGVLAPKDPSLEIYRAAIRALKARAEFWPIKRLRLATEAIDDIDAAAVSHPDCFEAQFLRAAILHDLPLVLGRRRESLRLIDKILPEIFLQGDRYPPSVLWLWSDFLIDAGVGSKAQKEALKTFRAANRAKIINKR